MSKNLKSLQNRAAAVANQMRALSNLTERSPEQDAELKSLVTQSGEVRQSLAFEANIAKEESELRSTIEQAAPAAATAPAAPAPQEPETRELRAKKTSLTWRFGAFTSPITPSFGPSTSAPRTSRPPTAAVGGSRPTFSRTPTTSSGARTTTSRPVPSVRTPTRPVAPSSPRSSLLA